MESSLQNEVVLKPSKSKSKIPDLKQMIQEDELLQNFFSVIKEQNLRAEAFTLLERRLGESDV